MKTTFKKSVLAFLTCVLALAFALTGCSGGGKDPKANFVGSWELSGGTVDGEELTDEYMKMLEDWGVHCVLILDEDGTGALDLFLEVVDLKWEAKDATTVTITAEDESHDMKLKDGKLILEEDDGNLVFTKSDKDLSGTVKKDREAAEKEEEIDEAVEDDDVQNVEISPAVTVADDDLCTITITEKFKDDWGDIGFVVNITNKSDKDLTFYAPSGKTNVNGTMKEPWFSANLMPGTSATEEFTFSSGELDSLDDLVNPRLPQLCGRETGGQPRLPRRVVLRAQVPDEHRQRRHVLLRPHDCAVREGDLEGLSSSFPIKTALRVQTAGFFDVLVLGKFHTISRWI